MNLIDYTVIRLTDKQQHLQLIDELEKRTSVIEYVMIDGDDPDDGFVKAALPYLIRKEKTQEWLGTVTRSVRPAKYIFRADKEIFRRLREYDGFFVNSADKNGEKVIRTDFGINDIAFRSESGEVLFYTTTHEGEAIISKEILL